MRGPGRERAEGERGGRGGEGKGGEGTCYDLSSLVASLCLDKECGDVRVSASLGDIKGCISSSVLVVDVYVCIGRLVRR